MSRLASRGIAATSTSPGLAVIGDDEFGVDGSHENVFQSAIIDRAHEARLVIHDDTYD